MSGLPRRLLLLYYCTAGQFGGAWSVQEEESGTDVQRVDLSMEEPLHPHCSSYLLERRGALQQVGPPGGPCRDPPLPPIKGIIYRYIKSGFPQQDKKPE